MTARDSGADHRRLANEVSSGGASGYTNRPDSGLMYTGGARISEIATFRDRPTSCEYAKRGSVRTRHRSGYSQRWPSTQPSLTEESIRSSSWSPIVREPRVRTVGEPVPWVPRRLIQACLSGPRFVRTRAATSRRAAHGACLLRPGDLHACAGSIIGRTAQRSVPATIRRFARACAHDRADGTAECACYYKAIRSRLRRR
jgi:hypothetical protein